MLKKLQDCQYILAWYLYSFCVLQEVQAAMTISQRGVRMVATAHGNDIHSLVQNPELLPLLGGVEVG